jgi:hypothetical protein
LLRGGGVRGFVWLLALVRLLDGDEVAILVGNLGREVTGEAESGTAEQKEGRRKA